MADEKSELPIGWKTKKLGTVIDLVSGQHLKKGEYSEGLTEGAIPYLTGPAEFGEAHPSPSRSTNIRRAIAKSGDVLITVKGSGVGKTNYVNDREIAISRQLMAARSKEHYINSKFLRLYLKACQQTFADKKIGAAIPGIGRKDVLEQTIPLPPLPEQERIVSKLDELFSRIDQAIANLQHTQAQTKALWESALDSAFKGFSYREKVRDLCLVKGGKRLPKGKKLTETPTNHPYIRVSDFTDSGTIDQSGVKYITEDIHQSISRYTISSNDLYISIAGTIGKTGIIPIKLDGANLTENAAKLVIKDRKKLNVRFLYYFTRSSDFSSQAGLATKVVAQPKLALARLSEIEIPVPNAEVQQNTISQLEAIANRTQKLESNTQSQLEKLEALKASLLDAAFKGQL